MKPHSSQERYTSSMKIVTTSSWLPSYTDSNVQ